MVSVCALDTTGKEKLRKAWEQHKAIMKDIQTIQEAGLLDLNIEIETVNTTKISLWEALMELKDKNGHTLIHSFGEYQDWLDATLDTKIILLQIKHCDEIQALLAILPKYFEQKRSTNSENGLLLWPWIKVKRFNMTPLTTALFLEMTTHLMNYYVPLK